MKSKLFVFLVFLQLAATILAQENINLAAPEKGAWAEASTTNEDPPWSYNPMQALNNNVRVRWETVKETTGAWLAVHFKQPEKVKELWILTQSVPFDIVLDPYLRSGSYLLPKKVTLSFSDGSSMDAELQSSYQFQIIKLPAVKTTNLVKITINEIWPKAGSIGTGISKIKVYGSDHVQTISINTFDLFNYINQKPVKSAQIEFLNPGAAIENAHLVVRSGGKQVDDVSLGTLAANTLSYSQVWIRSPYKDENYDISLFSGKSEIIKAGTIKVTAYKKTYFEGGTVNIHSTNHNDLGWLDTQFKTADYRSEELILPALKIMETDPNFTYTMECIEYFKEFLARHPEKKDEITKRMKEGRFTFAGSYVQMLEAHVGTEKLVRQFYLGRRWLKETFPGLDTKIYMKTDVPSMTYQLPQILKSAGMEYMLQGRIPLGYYYWQGLDGTVIPTYGLRYWDPYQVLNPKNGEGWIKYLYKQENNYKIHNLPKILNYDYNADYIPPCPDLIPYVKEQNTAMTEFAKDWNNHYKEPEKQIQPPVLKFTNPMDMLNKIYSDPNINIETMKGEWPLSWAYYDEPSNREALLTGRIAHNEILAAEKMYTVLKQINPDIKYPKSLFDSAWMANCWPEHGWGGNKGLQTDSIYFATYKKSRAMADKLLSGATENLSKMLPEASSSEIPMIVFNTLNWERTSKVQCSVTIPAGWKGFKVLNAAKIQIPYEITGKQGNTYDILVIAGNVLSMGFSNYTIEKAAGVSNDVKPLSGDSIVTENMKIIFGKAGIKSIINKANNYNYINSGKFEAGEILQFSAPGNAWDDWWTHEDVNMEDFDKSTNHETHVIKFVETPVRIIREVETKFKYFTSVNRYIVYKSTGDLEVETDVLSWNGTHSRELRIAFPFNMEQQKVSYEIPFGTADYMKDEIDFSFWRNNAETNFGQFVSGGKAQLPYREAINWINTSSGLIGANKEGFGCLMASDMTVHQFEDQTSNPVSYPVMQHVLLSSRRSLAWNPDYFYEQKGDHHYHMAFYFHDGNWRFRYRDGIGFNNPLIAVCAATNATGSLQKAQSFITCNPSNIIITAMKRSEDGKGTIIRFYEAEGKKCTATIHSTKTIKQAFRTTILEYEPAALPVNTDGSVSLPVKPWEIVTLLIND